MGMGSNYYLISMGEYEAYRIKALAIHERTWTEHELRVLQDQVVNRYITADGPMEDYLVDEVQLRKVLSDVLKENGFFEAPITGELHYGDRRMDEIGFTEKPL
jgi:hypothetical protein